MRHVLVQNLLDDCRIAQSGIHYTLPVVKSAFADPTTSPMMRDWSHN
jgi:hypothetical protein